MIKEYFANYFLHTSDVTFDMKNNQMEVHKQNAEPWKVTLIDTGINTMTGGRLKKVQKFVEDETFCFTYGDGLCNLDIRKSIDFHKKSNNFGTVTAVQPPGRFGALDVSETKVLSFKEKPNGDNSWINGGFFVFEPKIFDYIDDDDTILERSPLEKLANDGKLGAYRHEGFWQALDTLRDRTQLESLWNNGTAPWKTW